MHIELLECADEEEKLKPLLIISSHLFHQPRSAQVVPKFFYFRLIETTMVWAGGGGGFLKPSQICGSTGSGF